MTLKRIRRAVRGDRYEYSSHALDEMDADELFEDDVMAVLLEGRIVATMTDDPRGPRYVLRGLAPSTRQEGEVVCRFLPSGILRIITAYLLDE